MELTKDVVEDALMDVYDPELYVDVVSLGLIYDIDIDGDDVAVTMTLTFPGCPYGDQLTSDVRDSVLELDTVRNVSVDLTFQPRWSPDNIDDDIRAAIGF